MDEDGFRVKPVYLHNAGTIAFVQRLDQDKIRKYDPVANEIGTAISNPEVDISLFLPLVNGKPPKTTVSDMVRVVGNYSLLSIFF